MLDFRCVVTLKNEIYTIIEEKEFLEYQVMTKRNIIFFIVL